MPGQRREFEERIEATVAAYDDLPADARASVLTQLANQLRVRNGDHTLSNDTDD